VQLVVVDSRLLIYGMPMYKSCWRSLSGRVGITRSFCHHNPVVVQQLADSAVLLLRKRDDVLCFVVLKTWVLS
jgi:hypothetical protein